MLNLIHTLLCSMQKVHFWLPILLRKFKSIRFRKRSVRIFIINLFLSLDFSFLFLTNIVISRFLCCNYVYIRIRIRTTIKPILIFVNRFLRFENVDGWLLWFFLFGLIHLSLRRTIFIFAIQLLLAELTRNLRNFYH